MHCKSLYSLGLGALSALVMSSTALAAGAHAGGHGHDDEAIGKPGVAARANRTVTVDMTDAMRFSPASINVKRNETVRFIVKNSGKIKHEFVLGTEQELKEHYEQMKKFPEMEHADPNMVTVAPGKTGEVVWQFTRAGKVDFACLQPGHYEAGMKGYVKVAAGKPDTAAGHANEAAADGTARPAAQVVASAAPELSDGVVRKIDKEAGKLTIKHGPIRHLDMPPMSMVFTAGEKAMLDRVQVGDRIRFMVVDEGGKMVVTDIRPAN